MRPFADKTASKNVKGISGMNREFLKGLGVDDENIEKIMTEHGKTVTKVKDDLTSAQSDLDVLKGQLTERDKQLDELSEKAKGNEDLTQKIEELKKENEQKIKDALADALKAKKVALLVKAGYTDEQVDRYSRFIVGESDEELTKSIEEFTADVPPKPKYVDPNPMNGERGKPDPVDPVEKGRGLFQKLRGQ